MFSFAIIMGFLRRKIIIHTLKCPRCGQEFENSWKPPPGKVLNCKDCDEQILLAELAKEKDKSKKKDILNKILLVRKR